MDIDTDRLDETVPGLLWLTLHDERRSWKGHDWGVLDRLFAQGMIYDPMNKAKSVVLTDEGLAKAEEVFHALFVGSEGIADYTPAPPKPEYWVDPNKSTKHDMGPRTRDLVNL